MHRALGRMAAAELVSVASMGNQKHYQANTASPVFEELSSLVRIGRLKLEPPAVWRVLAKAHERRNLAEYEGHLEQDDQLLTDLIGTAKRLREAIDGLTAYGTVP